MTPAVRKIGVRLLAALIVLLSLALGSPAGAQTAGDYRSAATGNWNAIGTWQRYDGSNWVAAVATPTSADGVITIRSPHVVTITATVTYDQVVVDAGGQVTVAATVTHTLANGAGLDLSIDGTWLNQGGTWTVTGASWRAQTGGTYIHNTTSSAATPLGVATFAFGSTCIYRGSSTLTPAVSVAGRTFGNLAFESTSGSWSASVTGATALAVDNSFTIGPNVTYNNALTGATTIGTNFTNNGTLTNGSGTQVYTFTGNGYSISGTGAITFETWNISNGAVITLNQAVTEAASFAGTVAAGGTLIAAATLTNSGTMNVNGTFQLNNGGFASGTDFVYGASGTLVFNNSSGSYGVNAGHVYWPAASGPPNVNVQGAGGVTLNTNRTVSGLFQTSAGFLGGVLTVNGTCQINAGGFFGAAPGYGAASTLRYNTGGTYGRGVEWSNTSGLGYPNNVQISNNTTLDMAANAGAGTARQAAGSLTIDSGSTLSLATSGGMTQPVSFLKDASIAGTLALSTNIGGDFNLGGNWTRTGTFTPNSRAVGFNGSVTQSLTGATTFDYLILNNGAGLSLGNDATVSQTLTLTNGKITTGANKVIIGPTGSVSGANSSRYINGNLQKRVTVAFSTFAQSFEIGDATTYAPVSISQDAPAGGPSGDVTASTTTLDHPQIGTSGINPAKSVNRYWTMSNSGLGFTSYKATFNFANPGDVDGGATPASFITNRYTGGTWFPTGTGTRTATSTEATGITSFSDFQVGEANPTWTITASAGAGGTISPIGAVPVNNGASQTFTITPDSCFTILDVIVDGTPVGAQTSYTFSNVTADHTIEAQFAAASYTINAGICIDENLGTAHGGITTQSLDGGAITPSGAVAVACGAGQTFNFMPEPCYHVAAVVVDGNFIGAPSSYTFTNVTANHGICVSFALDTYTITASAGPGGTIAPNGASTVNCGTSLEYTMTPDPCYQVDQVLVDGIPVGPMTSYTFTDISADHTISVTFVLATYTITAQVVNGHGQISPDGSVVVNCGANQTFTLTPDPCYHVLDIVVDGAHVGPAPTYTFTNVQADHTIEAYFAIDTYTITASAGAGGAIAPSGAVSVDCGSDQTFTITPDPCYAIADVQADNVSVGAVGTYTFTNVQANHTIHVSFAGISYTITASAGPGGAISPSGAVSVGCGQDQTFAITPDLCYHIADVLVDGVSVGTPASYTFTDVTADHTIAASFALTTYTITAQVVNGNGQISPNGAVSVNCGADQTFTLTPDPCYHVLDIVVDGAHVGPAASYTFTNVQADHTIEAYFAIDTYTITASAGAGGSIAPNGAVSVDCGSDQTFAITPDPCYAIADVKVDNVSVGAVGTYTFTNVQANHTVSATFVLTTYTITASAGANGAITPNGAVSVNCGADQTFTITPDPCYHIDDVLVDGASVGAVGTYTFFSANANHTIAASFAIDTYTITASSGPNGTINPIGAVVVNCGDSQTFTFIADACYLESDVIVDGESLGPLGSYTFSNVTANHTIHVTWVLATYTITASAGPGGSIAPAGAVGVNCGAGQTFAITPDPCFQIADVKVDGVSVGAVASYTFTNVVANHAIAATFVQTSYVITATNGPNGGIAPSGAVNVPCGGTANFVITPNPGFAIDDVLVDAVSVGAVPNYTFTDVQANHTIHATFRDIECPAVTVTAPNGGETYIIGMPVNLTWTATDNVGVTCVDILLSRTGGGGPFTPLATCAANLGTYAWVVTGPATNNAVVRVVGHDAAGNECYDDSDAEFRIINFVVPVLLSQFQANPVGAGVELRWSLTDDATFARTGIERGEAAGGPFTPLAGAVRTENRESVLLDDGVTAGQTYYYRITGVTRAGQVVTFEPLAVIAGLPVTEFALPAVSPNPVRGVAHINFAVPRESHVRVTVLDVQGRPVATLADGNYTTGRYQVRWSGDTESGAAPSGIYFIRLDALATKLVQRVVLVH